MAHLDSADLTNDFEERAIEILEDLKRVDPGGFYGSDELADVKRRARDLLEDHRREVWLRA